MNVNTIKLNLFDFIAENLALDPILADNKKRIIWANQNSPEPESPYVVLNIISGFRQLGNDTLIYKSGNDKFHVDGIREMTLSIQVRGKDALKIISDFQNRLNLPEVLEDLDAKGFGIVNFTDIVDLSDLKETTFEDIRVIDLILYLNNTLGENDLESSLPPLENMEGVYDISGKTGTYDVETN